MTTETPETPDQARRLSDEQLVDVMRLIKGTDSVELKMTVPASGQRSSIAKLPLDPVEAIPRQVFFFDTPDLDLYQAGVVVRARRVQGGRGDTVVKLRPVEPADLPDELRRSGSFNVEVDLLPGGYVCSASLKGRTTGQAVRDAVSGALPLRKLLSKEQRAFYADRAPAGIELDALSVLGPTFVLKVAFEPEILDHRLVAELWFYPDGSRIFELSTKCDPGQTFQVAAEARAYLAGLGIVGGSTQETKTKTALEFYSEELRAGRAGMAALPEAGGAAT